jgi:hypothetical protein
MWGEKLNVEKKQIAVVLHSSTHHSDGIITKFGLVEVRVNRVNFVRVNVDIF